jgi:hypothetical protein
LVQNELETLTREAKDFYSTVTQATGLYQKLNLEYEDLRPGEGEMGISVPRDAFDPTTKNYERLIKQLDFILETFNEIATNNQQRITLKSVSSSDWQFYVECAFSVLVLLPAAIEKIMDLLIKYLDFKKKLQEFRDGKIPDDALQPVRDYLEKYLPEERKRLANELVVQHAAGADDGRKNELVIRLDIALSHIIDLKERGTTFEVRAALPTPPKTAGDGDVADPQVLEAYEKKKELVELINAKELVIRDLRVTERVALPPPPDIP